MTNEREKEFRLLAKALRATDASATIMTELFEEIDSLRIEISHLKTVNKEFENLTEEWRYSN